MPKLNYCTINWFLTYQEYLDQFAKQANIESKVSLSEAEKNKTEFIKLNFQRSSRLEKTFEPDNESYQVFSQITQKQQWIIITESWCGDSAQSVPVIAKLAQINGNIDLKIVFRDSNLDFMDLYLTNGGRSVPKLIAFDENNNELFQWGPRPAFAQNLMMEMKNNGVPKDEMNKSLHLWYGRNRGKEIEKELLEIVKNLKQPICL